MTDEAPPPPKKRVTYYRIGGGRRPGAGAKGTRIDVLAEQIPMLMGKGLNGMQIMQQLNIKDSTYRLACKRIRENIKSRDVAAEKSLKLVSVAEETLTMALADYAVARKLMVNEDGEFDPKKYQPLSKHIKTVVDAKWSLEKTYARFGLVPSEKQIVKHEGAVDSPQVKVFAIDPSRYDAAMAGRRQSSGSEEGASFVRGVRSESDEAK